MVRWRWLAAKIGLLAVAGGKNWSPGGGGWQKLVPKEISATFGMLDVKPSRDRYVGRLTGPETAMWDVKPDVETAMLDI